MRGTLYDTGRDVEKATGMSGFNLTITVIRLERQLRVQERLLISQQATMSGSSELPVTAAVGESGTPTSAGTHAQVHTSPPHSKGEKAIVRETADAPSEAREKCIPLLTLF